MGYQFPPDVEELVSQRIASGNYATEDDVLRDALQALAEQAADLEAVEVAIAGMRAGEKGEPLADVFDEIRRSKLSEE